MVSDLLDNLEKCPILVIYTIIQIGIQIYDVYYRNFIAAFIHFWIGFVFYINYKEILCTGRDIENLGIDNFLIILSFLFCQIVLVGLLNKLRGNVVITATGDKKNNKYEKWRDDIPSDKFMVNDKQYKKLKVKANMVPSKLHVSPRDLNIFDIGRGSELYLKNGNVVTVIGVEKSSIDESIIIKLDEEIYYQEDYVYINSNKENEKEKMNELNVKSKVNEDIGRKRDSLKGRIIEVEKNISLLIDEINKKNKELQKLYDEDERRAEERNKEWEKVTELKKELERLNMDKKQQENLLKSFKEQLMFLKKYRKELKGRLGEIQKGLGE